jgi:hypothetical protein
MYGGSGTRPIRRAADQHQPQRAGLDGECLAGLRVAAGPGEQLPEAVRGLAEVEPLPIPAGPLPPTDQPGWEHLRVVEHQQVAGVEQVRQVAEDAVFQLSGGPADDEQPRLVPTGGRLLRDQALGQGVVEEGGHSRRKASGGGEPPERR